MIAVRGQTVLVRAPEQRTFFSLVRGDSGRPVYAIPQVRLCHPTAVSTRAVAANSPAVPCVLPMPWCSRRETARASSAGRRMRASTARGGDAAILAETDSNDSKSIMRCKSLRSDS